MQRRESPRLIHDDFDENDARAMIESSSAYLLIAVTALTWEIFQRALSSLGL